MTGPNVTNLTCEYQKNSIGIDVKNPTFSWQLESDRRATFQAAYQVQVSTSKNFENSIWDTGKVESDQSIQLMYSGPIQSRTLYFTRVKVWDNYNRVSDWSEVSSWETAFLDRNEWEASWITPDETKLDPQSEEIFQLRKAFTLEKDIASARVMRQRVPFVIPDLPNLMGGNSSSAAWGDAATVCPWTVYMVYGDKSVLKDQYDSMKAWVEYIRKQGENEFLWNTGFHFGDWLGLDAKENSYVGAAPRDFIATAFYFNSTRILRNSAIVLEKYEDAAEYSSLLKKIKETFVQEFISPTGRLASPTQTAHVLALAFDLVEGDTKKRVASDLNNLVIENDYHLTTGFVGTPYLCFALSENGYHDTAMKLLLQDSYPSWLYSVKKGATTIWEHRDSIKADGSFWSDDMNSWEWKKDEISVRVEIPANTTATIELPNVHSGDLMENNVEAVHAEGVVQVVNQDGNVRIEIRSGVYTFTYPNQMGSLDQFTKNSRVLDLLSSSKAMEVLEKHSPGISEKIGPFSHMKAYTLTRFAKEPTIQLKDVDSILQEINNAILAGKKENNHEYSKA